MDREQIKTTPEMTINVLQILKMYSDTVSLYAAQLIEELEEKLNSQHQYENAMREKYNLSPYIEFGDLARLVYHHKNDLDRAKAQDEEIKRRNSLLAEAHSYLPTGFVDINDLKKRIERALAGDPPCTPTQD